MRGITAFTRRQAIAWGSVALAATQWPKTLSALASAVEAAPRWSIDNPFLSRAFAPVFDERDDVDLVIEGEIPKSLRGVFMRNGPNPQFRPDSHYAYPFDGTGMIHAIYIEHGKARYRNRWVLTRELAAERAAGHRLYNSTFNPPPHADLANTNVIYHAGRYLALYEGGVPYELTSDLKTVGPYDFDGQLPGPMSAHPKLDPVTGELLSLAYNLESKTLTYLRADKSGGLTGTCQFRRRGQPWCMTLQLLSIISSRSFVPWYSIFHILAHRLRGSQTGGAWLRSYHEMPGPLPMSRGFKERRSFNFTR